MSSLPHAGASVAPERSAAPAARRIAEAGAALTLADLPPAAVTKVKVCLMDLIGCAFEAHALPWSVQARALASTVTGDGASIIGSPAPASAGEAAFANAVMGHGLVREDMHSGSVSHLGIVVLPTLLALAESRAVTGADFIAAAVVGYEAGAQVGRAVMDPQLARIHRPTGIAGPIGAAAAGSRLLGLPVPAFTSAVALGTNTTLGFNQWAHTGGSEMFFQAGFGARNAVTAIRLAAMGTFASPDAIDGVAGLCASLHKPEAGGRIRMFEAAPEILAVYHKPVPACNFAQTACLAALGIARETRLAADRIRAIRIRVPRAGALYPGCDATGPFEHVLQGKMSIQFNVAAALLEGSVSERNFTLLDDPRLHRLIGVSTLEVDDAMTRAYPALQGGEVEVLTETGETHRLRLDNVVNATDDEVRARFLEATGAFMGAARASEISACIDGLENLADAGQLGRLLRAPRG